MKSPSAAAYDLGAQAAATFEADLMRCRHPQAEPVILTTGELVACVCIGCYQQLPADYIEEQAETAHRLAYCSHRGSRFSRSTCSECGRPVPKGTFPNIRPGGISDSEWLAFQCDHSETMAYADFDRVPAGSRFRCVECGDWVSDSTTADHEG